MKILCLGAHTDDVEVGCGGSVVKFIEERNDLYYAAFSIAEDSLPEGLPKDTLLKEVKLSTKILGIKSENLFIYRYPVRKFPQFRQEILEDLVKLNKKIKPELVLMPSKYDTHQDHHIIAMEGFRAFRFTTILGYEILQGCNAFDATLFVILNKHHIDKKVAALSCFKSQKLRTEKAGNKFVALENARMASQVAGYRVRADYAEVFNIVRWIMK